MYGKAVLVRKNKLKKKTSTEDTITNEFKRICDAKWNYVRMLYFQKTFDGIVKTNIYQVGVRGLKTSQANDYIIEWFTRLRVRTGYYYLSKLCTFHRNNLTLYMHFHPNEIYSWCRCCTVSSCRMSFGLFFSRSHISHLGWLCRTCAYSPSSRQLHFGFHFKWLRRVPCEILVLFFSFNFIFVLWHSMIQFNMLKTVRIRLKKKKSKPSIKSTNIHCTLNANSRVLNKVHCLVIVFSFFYYCNMKLQLVFFIFFAPCLSHASLAFVLCLPCDVCLAFFFSFFFGDIQNCASISLVEQCSYSLLSHLHDRCKSKILCYLLSRVASSMHRFESNRACNFIVRFRLYKA